LTQKDIDMVNKLYIRAKHLKVGCYGWSRANNFIRHS
jgi:hypothetical protein